MTFSKIITRQLHQNSAPALTPVLLKMPTPTHSNFPPSPICIISSDSSSTGLIMFIMHCNRNNTHLSVQGLPVHGALLKRWMGKMMLYRPCSPRNSIFFADANPALPTHSNKYTEYTQYYKRLQKKIKLSL
jgi:hypothetical protein